MARLTASGPVTLLGIQMEKKMAPTLPSRMRGMSMLPAEVRVPRSNLPSRRRCVVSSWVSTTMHEKCSLRARSERPSAFIAPARSTLAATHAPVHRMARTISRLLVLLLSRLHLFADLLRLLHYAKNVAAQYLADVLFRISLAQQRFCDLGKLRAIFQAIRHVRAVEVRPQADVVGAHQSYHVVDVLDDFLPAHVRKLSGFGQFLFQPDLRLADANIVIAALLLEFLLHAAHVPRNSREGSSVFLAQIISLVVDLDHSAFCRQHLDHVVAHIPRMIRNGANRRVRSNQWHPADFQGVVKSLVGNVGDVHQHALAVHFADHLLAEMGKSVVRRLVGGRVRPLVIVKMRERHIAHSERAVDAYHSNVIANHVATLYAHEDGNLAQRVCAADFLGGSR